MRHTITSQQALTLTELLVASFLMGIVMIGIAGFSVAIKRMQDTTDKQAILAMQTAAVITHMERRITRAFGSQSSPGFVFNTANPRSWWSFRLDVNNTPDNTADDNWLVYWKQNSGANNERLYTCIQPDGVAPDTGPGPGPTAGSGPCSTGNAQRLIDKVISLSITETVNPSPSALGYYYTVTLTTRFNTSNAEDPFDNPEYTMSTRVHAPGHSWN